MNKPLNDPENRIVSIFPDLEHASEAMQKLEAGGFDVANAKLFHGENAAKQVDDSAKWFADTDIEIERFKRALADGQAILSVALESESQRNEVESVLATANATLSTYFGQWVTETTDLND